ncbi:hypothetical protein MKX01_010861 [Papaver californicum]|nr:hypothetical protein MKX01_010861 [Papaver californicum]
MYIEELKEKGELEVGVKRELVAIEKDDVQNKEIVSFLPTLLYNFVRNKMQSEFRWLDCVDEFILLGAVPFPTNVPRLKQLGVHGVITLNETYETLVPTSLYQIDHLVLPTRDYLFAPSYNNICRAVDFIHNFGNLLTSYTTMQQLKGSSVQMCFMGQNCESLSPALLSSQQVFFISSLEVGLFSFHSIEQWRVWGFLNSEYGKDRKPAYKMLSAPRSRLPSCEHRYGGYVPCEAIQVPTTIDRVGI